MHRTRIVVIGVFSAVIVAAADSPQNRVGHSTRAKAGGPSTRGKSNANQPPLHIETADARIVKATVSGPEFAASTLFVGVEDPVSPVAKRLRDGVSARRRRRRRAQRVSQDAQAASLGSQPLAH